MISIRLARDADDADLARIDHESWSPQNSPSPHWERTRPFFGPPTGTQVGDVLVAEAADGSTLGYVKVAQVEAGRSRIAGLAVTRGARGRGLGLRLIEKALNLVRERGAELVDLKVLGSNTPAIRVYMQAGFVEAERVPGRFTLEGRSVDDVTMLRQF